MLFVNELCISIGAEVKKEWMNKKSHKCPRVHTSNAVEKEFILYIIMV
jgi:hypothetical protein